MLNIATIHISDVRIDQIKQCSDDENFKILGQFNSFEETLKSGFFFKLDIVLIDPNKLQKNDLALLLSKDLYDSSAQFIVISDIANIDVLDYLNRGVLECYDKSENYIKELFVLFEGVANRKNYIEILNEKKIKKPTFQNETKVELIALGISTGGPVALKTLFENISDIPSVPIVIVMHIHSFFVQKIVDELNSLFELSFTVAQNNQILEAGMVYIAPGEKQLKIELDKLKKVIKITDDPHEDNCRPSINYFFRSISKIYTDNVTAIVMTGMGVDGTTGAKLIKTAKGNVFAQDKFSSAVYSMPKSIIDAGLADKVLSIKEIAKYISLK